MSEYELVHAGDELFERLESAAYAYRAWPAHDPDGVRERFEALCKVVGEYVLRERHEGLADAARESDR